jgi:cytoskeletal protein CcmA (bactofilin family)
MWKFSAKKKNILEDGEPFTFLGRNVEFKGVVSFEGTARIDGRLDGEVHTNGTLIVAEHAVIKGIISTGTLISGGKIYGTVSATERVQLVKPAVVIGDIRTPALSVEDGVHFHGMSDMGAKGRPETESPSPVLEKVHDLTALRGRLRQDTPS